MTFFGNSRGSRDSRGNPTGWESFLINPVIGMGWEKKATGSLFRTFLIEYFMVLLVSFTVRVSSVLLFNCLCKTNITFGKINTFSRWWN